MYKRKLSERLKQSPKSVLLLGPRQVGKSTLLRSLKPELMINLSHPLQYKEFVQNQNELIERIQLLDPKTVLVDEIQRLPELLNSVQFLLDEHPGRYKFYLSGSSARKLRRGSANLLPGRVLSFRLGPFSCLEHDFKMNSKTAIELGTLPEPYLLKDRGVAEKLLTTYAGTYLQEEILAETLVRDLQGFSSFLEVVAAGSGLLLDFTKLCQRAHVSRSAARRYFEILEDTLLCHRLRPWAYEDSEEKNQSLIKHQKYYLFDGGVCNAILGNFRVSKDRVGLCFEHLFYNQMHNTFSCLDIKLDLYFYRTREGKEVDFVLRYESQIFLIETKTSNPGGDDISRLNEVARNFPQDAIKYIACLEEVSPRLASGVRVLPWQKVIKEIVDRR